MSFIVAGAMFAAGAYSAYQNQKGKYANAYERRRAARESLLTASYNIRQRNKESRQTQFETLDYGGNIIQKIAVAGKQAEGTALVAGGSSGAVAESGSSRAALGAIVKQALVAQTEVVLDTKHRIKSIARDTDNMNISEWRNAKLHEKQQNRIASLEMKSANREFTADIINSVARGYGAGSTASGTGDISKWGSKAKTIDTTKQIGTTKQIVHGGRGGVKRTAPTIDQSRKILSKKSASYIYQNRDWQYKDMMKRRGRGYKLPWLK